jgi:ATP-binding cassette, subfamily C, bacterial
MLKTNTFGLIGQLLRAYPRRSAFMVLLLLISGLAEGIGLMTLLPVLEIALTDSADLSRPSLVIVALLASLGLAPTLPLLLLIVVLAITTKALFQFLAMWKAGNTVAHVATDLRLAYIDAVLGARWSYFVHERAGNIATAVSAEAHRAAMAYRHACSVVALLVQSVVYLTIAILVSWQVAGMGLLAGVVLTLLLGHLVKKSRNAGRQQTETTRALVARMTDAMAGIKAIKAMGRERDLQPLLESEARGINSAYRSHVLAQEGLRQSQEPLLVGMLSVALYFAIAVMQQALPAVMVLAFVFYRLVGRIGLVQSEYQTLANSEGAYYVIKAGIRAAREASEVYSGATIADLRGAVEFRNVSFDYGETSVLRNVSFRIPLGQFVTLVGASGAGKTTVADLLVGLRVPDSGEVLIDGVSLQDVSLKQWRTSIGYVPQELFLFHDSLLKNITLGNRLFSETDAWEALELAGAADFVRALPDDIHTVVGERGARLSGGQRQRVAVARALCGNPKLLVLDEVTASLDPDTEAALCETLRKLRGRVTIFAISHQAALMKPADVVYRADCGQITPIDEAAHLFAQAT